MKNLISLLFLMLAGIAWCMQVPDHYQAVSKIIGKPGTLNADGSFRINIPRVDVSFKTASGMPIPADMGLSTYIAFTGSAERVLAVGDVAMLAPEIDAIVDELHAAGFEIVALHNHMTSEAPRLFYLHFQLTGKPNDIATAFKRAVDRLGKAYEVATTTNSVKPKLDAEALSSIFDSKPQVFPSGVLRFSNPRKDISVGIGDLSFLPGMGLASWAAFNACDCGLTMVMGDTCCLRSDLQEVIGSLRKGGIHITAIHNHILGGTQEVEFLHYEAEGDAATLAKAIKACWNTIGKSR